MRRRSLRAATLLATSAALVGLSACSDEGRSPDATVTEEGTSQELAPAIALPRPRGLWVLCEGAIRVLDEPGRIDPMIADARALGTTDLFVQVYRGGRAWFDSSLADAGPFDEARALHSEDPLQRLIERAHAAGLRVHAWVNVLSLSKNAEAPLLADIGRDAVLVDGRGRSVLDYPDYELPAPDREYYRMGTRGIYLDPANPAVSQRLVATFAELIDRYPELDGLHLDYIRHPAVLPLIPGSRFGVGLDFGYGPVSRTRFQRDTGLEAPGPGRMVNNDRWDDWRRAQVTALVAAIASETRARRPGLQISAAVISYLDRAYLTLAQDWSRWLEDGTVDFAVPMAYTRDDRLLRYQLERFAGHPRADRIWAGVGSWLFAKEPARARRQVEIVREVGVAGDALFSYDSIVEKRDSGLLEALRPSPRSERDGDG